MPYRTPPNRAEEYRQRAEECRTQAKASENPETRKALLETADTWERMAIYEDRHNPPRKPG